MSNVNSPHIRRGFASCAAAVALGTALFACPGTAAANWVTVGCTGAPTGSYDYTSLADAIASLKAISHRDHYILVSGTCTEVASLDRMENITIAGTLGAVLSEPSGPKLTYSVLGIGGSTGIAIENLTFRGTDARRALLNIYDSNVEVRDCVFEQSSEGIFVHGNSNAFIRRSIIQDTDWYGIRVDGNANVGIGDVENDVVPTVIRRNSGAGVIARNQGVASIHGATQITDNGTGVSGQSGTVAFCCGVHERLVSGNTQGLSIQAGGTLIVEGPLRIEDNRSTGISLTGATAHFVWGRYAVRNNGSSGIVVGYGASLSLSGEGAIENHPQAGILLMGGTASVAGDFSIRNNGAPGRDSSGGVVAQNGSSVSLTTGATGSVTANAGPGLLVTHNSTARLLWATVSGNQAEGVRVAALSSVLLLAPNTITGNAGFDLVCMPNSYGSGNSSGVGRMFCPAFDKLLSPPAGPGLD
jgi:hypothetical protein